MAKHSKQSSKPFKRMPNKPSVPKGQSTISLKAKSSGKSSKSKKTKRLQKRSSLLSKLTVDHEAKEKLRKSKLRSQTAVVGDMNPLLCALTDITMDKTQQRVKTVRFNDVTTNSLMEKKKRKKTIPSERSRQQSDINDIALFQQVLSHPKFKADPVTAISEHVKYLVQERD